MKKKDDCIQKNHKEQKILYYEYEGVKYKMIT